MKKLFEEYVEDIGELSKSKLKNSMAWAIAMLYTVGGMVCIQMIKRFSDKSLVNKIIGYFVSGLCFIAGLAMFCYLFSLLFKHFSHKTSKLKNCIWIFFLLLLPILELMKLLQFIIRKTKQRIVVRYIIEYYLSFLITAVFIFALVFIYIYFVDNKINVICDELFVFILIIGTMEIYSLITRLILSISLKWEIRVWQKWKLEKRKDELFVKSVGQFMKTDKMKNERKRRYKELRAKVEDELSYTKIYLYIIANVFILCVPIGDSPIRTLFVNEFVGITALSALIREVRAKL